MFTVIPEYDQTWLQNEPADPYLENPAIPSSYNLGFRTAPSLEGLSASIVGRGSLMMMHNAEIRPDGVRTWGARIELSSLTALMGAGATESKALWTEPHGNFAMHSDGRMTVELAVGQTASGEPIVIRGTRVAELF